MRREFFQGGTSFFCVFDGWLGFVLGLAWHSAVRTVSVEPRDGLSDDAGQVAALLARILWDATMVGGLEGVEAA